MKNYTILLLCQKGGCGKSTLADELTFALKRKGKDVSFITTDPQGGRVHSNTKGSNSTFQVVDTAGVLTDGYSDWCRAANMILVPMKPSPKDLEPAMRTYDIAAGSKTRARIGIVINEYNPREILSRQLKEFLLEQNYPIITEVPRTVLLAQASARGISIAEYDKRNPSVAVFDNLANMVISDYRQIGYSNDR